MKNNLMCIVLGLAVVLCVSSGCGNGSSGDTSNVGPTANAGSTQDVNTAATVTLDGSESTDPDADDLTYAWTQTSGTTVTFDDATAEAPTFTAPAVPDTLVFQLIVNDGTVDSDPTTVTIRVWT